MSAILSIIAGVIGANLVSEHWPKSAMKGFLNVALGIVGGLAVWGVMYLFTLIVPNMSGVVLIVLLGALGGAFMTLGSAFALNLSQDAFDPFKD